MQNALDEVESINRLKGIEMKRLLMIPALLLTVFALAACDAPQDGAPPPPADEPMDSAPLE